jgi:hypothetical protein
MERCTNCGREIGELIYPIYKYCDGILTMDVDPFASEIHGDETLYEDCEGGRHDSAWEI